jgi:hypothetical protein
VVMSESDNKPHVYFSFGICRGTFLDVIRVYISFQWKWFWKPSWGSFGPMYVSICVGNEYR